MQFVEEQFLYEPVVPSSATYTYVVLTKEKARTYPIITTLPPSANALRMELSVSLPKVKIQNKDSQFLDSVTNLIHGLGGQEVDVVHSQMLYEYWKREEKGRQNNQPRSLIITPQFLLLCDDDFTCLTDIKITLIDSCPIKDIVKIRMENDPLKITIIMKSNANIFKSQKKWRLCCDAISGVTKVKEECKKVMSGL